MKQSFAIVFLVSLLSACAVKTPVKYEYKLADFGYEKENKRHSPTSILVSEPLAVTGYQTEEMLYMNKPFELSPFAKNAWVGPPASMLFPLILQSLQSSSFFYAVASTPYAAHADYRLDTQLIALQQNFLVQPSVVELVVKSVLTRVDDNQVLASRIFGQHVTCLENTPYGGVLAANKATKLLTTELSKFVIDVIKRDRK